MRILASILCVGLSISMFAQSLEGIEDKQYNTISIGNVSGKLGSNAMPGGVLYKLFTGKDIDNAAVDKILDEMPETLMGLGKAKATWFSYTLTANDNSIGLHFSVEDEVVFGASTNKDFLYMVWRGTGYFRGERADLTPLAANAHYYRKYQVGISKRIGLGEVYVRPFVAQGIAALKTNKDEASLTFDEEGEFIDVKANLRYDYAGAFDNEETRKQGFGGGVDLGMITNIGKFKTTFALNNLGAIKYNQASAIATNVVYKYEGVDVLDSNYANTFREVFRLRENDSSFFTMGLASNAFVEVEKSGKFFGYRLRYFQPLNKRLSQNLAPTLSAEVILGKEHRLAFKPVLAVSVAEGVYSGFGVDLGIGPTCLNFGLGGLDPFGTQGGNVMANIGLGIRF